MEVDENNDKMEVGENNDNEMKDENDDEMEEIKNSDNEINANDMKNNNFNSKLITLEEILSGNLKKMSAYDYLRYRAIHVFFKG